ncbi:unnamed protein product [Ascophyllum nodosum]
MVFDRFGLAQPHNKCISKAATCHGNSTVQAASNNSEGLGVHALINELPIRRAKNTGWRHTPTSPDICWRGKSSTSSVEILFCFTSGTFIPHATSSLQTRGMLVNIQQLHLQGRLC